jgi:methylenetetrahydrofolate--tRNA-(uracil-5-)-methyltransferase
MAVGKPEGYAVRGHPITIIGGGLAGCEAAYQAARLGVGVALVEMRPGRMTPAHRTGLLAELVCSNSLKSREPTNAHGLLKEELRRLGSCVLAAAERHAVAAGKALAVDREGFAHEVTRLMEGIPGVRIERREAQTVPETGITIIATGPLTSEALAASIEVVVGQDALSFYDALAPIVDASSIFEDMVFAASRHGVNDAAYLNCPLDRARYEVLVRELSQARQFPLRDFEEPRFFRGCLPLEEVARSSPAALRFGALKPVGLSDPRTGRRPYAVVQLRPENQDRTAYGMVGFQTRLLREEQERIFRMIPGLERAVFFRYGAAHRNTYLDAPRVLDHALRCRTRTDIYFAGQLTGSEGYVESIGTGLLAGINAARRHRGEDPLVLPGSTMLGALCSYLSGSSMRPFQPMNANFGLLPPLPDGHRPRGERNRELAERSLGALDRALAAETWHIRGNHLPSDVNSEGHFSGIP